MSAEMRTPAGITNDRSGAADLAARQASDEQAGPVQRERTDERRNQAPTTVRDAESFRSAVTGTTGRQARQNEAKRSTQD